MYPELKKMKIFPQLKKMKKINKKKVTLNKKKAVAHHIRTAAENLPKHLASQYKKEVGDLRNSKLTLN